MSTERELTQEEANALIIRLLGRGARVNLFPFEYGWLAQPVLTDQERSRGMQLGSGRFIIDRTGVVTEHPSLPIPLLIRQYSQARREGRIRGRQVWPTTSPAA